MTRLSGSNVLITGAGAGIGRLLAHEVARRGGRPVLWDISAEALERVAAELATIGVDPLTSVVDVGESAAVTAAADQVLAQVGSVDVLVNNAGIVSGKSIEDLSSAEIERTFRVNTLSNFWTTKAFLPAMIRRNRGHVVTVASASGLIGVSQLTDYASSKHAAVGFDESLRVELSHRAPGIRTTVVCPYYIDTGMFDGVRSRFPLLLPILPEEKVVAKMVRAIERDRARLHIPPILYALGVFRLLPARAFDAFMDLLGVNVSMDEFRGHGKATSDQSDSPSHSG
ncbi:MAG: SDR family oxidoreductase [Actinomycetia bacterium]|nr:SDR family oxidoreductase [Actinomycetes bacterium]